MEKSSIFDWSYLKNIEINEWFLAGGININNLEKASKISKKIDISSSLEDNPGVKSIEKIKKFLLKVKEINENRTI
jgi:phosphoribosylanthranilate isomerase